VSTNSPVDPVIGVGWDVSPHASLFNLLTAVKKNCKVYLISVKVSPGNSWKWYLLRVMLKDANNANNMYNSYIGRAMTASIINHRLPAVPYRSVNAQRWHLSNKPSNCFGLVHAQCMTVSLCTSVLTILYWRVQSAHDGLQSYPPVA